MAEHGSEPVGAYRLKQRQGADPHGTVGLGRNRARLVRLLRAVGVEDGHLEAEAFLRLQTHVHDGERLLDGGERVAARVD